MLLKKVCFAKTRLSQIIFSSTYAKLPKLPKVKELEDLSQARTLVKI